MANYSEYKVNYGNIWFNIGPNACIWIIWTQESHENALQAGWASNMTVWYKKDTTSIAVSVNFMVNYSELLVKYSNVLFDMGPNACNWIIWTQESHENALRTVWEGFHSALE